MTTTTMMWLMTISTITWVWQGLDYLHGSPIGHHGRLSSANCLIDNRFSVKLSDFGLYSLLAQEDVDTASQEYKRGKKIKSLFLMVKYNLKNRG